MGPQHPPFLLGTPRSGSSLLYRVIQGYLRQTRGVEGRGEIFFGPHPIRDDGEGIPAFRAAAVTSIVTAEQQGRIAEERVALLEKYRGRYFFKVFPDQAPLPVLQRLCESHRPIWIERRNLFDQFLSAAVSIATGVWAAIDWQPPAKASLDYAGGAGMVADAVMAYRELKKKLPAGPVVVYEDFAGDLDLGRLFSHLDWNEPFDAARIQFPPKQNEDSVWKLDRFKEPERVLEDYRRCKLNELFPI